MVSVNTVIADEPRPQMYGDFELLVPEHDQAFVYSRTLGNESALVLLNFSEKEVEVDLGAVGGVGGYQLVLGNYEGDTGKGDAGNRDGDGKLVLRGYEGRVYVR
jgi:oligo-1,6-glucosidase